MTLKEVTAYVRDALECLERSEYVEDVAMEDGELGLIIEDGPVVRIKVEILS